MSPSVVPVMALLCLLPQEPAVEAQQADAIFLGFFGACFSNLRTVVLPASVLTFCCKRGLHAYLSVYFSYMGNKTELAKILWSK